MANSADPDQIGFLGAVQSERSSFSQAYPLQELGSYKMLKLSHLMRRPAFAYTKTKMQISCAGNSTADRCLCSLYINSTIPIIPKSKISCD